MRVSVKNLDSDNRADVITSSGSKVTGYLGNAIATDSNPASSFEFDIEPGFTGGVFVG